MHHGNFEEFFLIEKSTFCLNQRLLPKRAAKFAKRDNCEVYRVTPVSGMMEQWNSGIAKRSNILRHGMAECSKTQNDGVS